MSRQSIINTAKSMISDLEGTIKGQSTQIKQQEETLNVERDRSKHLKSELSKFSDTHRGVLPAIESNALAIGEKLKALPSTDILKELLKSECNQNDLKSMIERAISTLQELGQKPSMGINDLKFLQEFVKGHDKRYDHASNLPVRC